MHSSQWHALRCWTPGSAKNIYTSTRAFLVAKNGWWLLIVRGCQCCKFFVGAVVKALLCPIQAYTPLELVHVDFTSIETTMELNQPLSVKNVLVLTDHFTRYMMAFITKDQKAKTVVHILYEWLISVFGVPAKLLSDQGVNFMSVLVEELCSAFGIQKCRTTTYHVQCNGQVERFHQTLCRMIGKLAMDKNAQWEQHLPELLQTYNSTQSAVMEYSPHYLMFGRQPCLPVDFFFPQLVLKQVDVMSLLMWKKCKRVSKRLMLKPSTNPTVKQTNRSAIMIKLQAQFNWCWET